MQLNKQHSAKNALKLATAVLLGAGAVKATEVESTLLIYSEQDRVSAAEGAVSIKHEISEDENIRVKATFDGLTGASPNGATPSNSIQTYTRPSGRGSYTIKPGEIPLDDTFNDVRFAASGTYSRKLGSLNNVFFGVNFSGEHDYTSVGLNGGISRDFNSRNTTASLSFSFTSDNINPEGGVPIPFASLPGVNELLPRTGSSDSKEVYDVLFGITQTLSRKTLMRVNYSRSRSNGYLSDPYKIISLVQDESSASPGEPLDFLYENRPRSRTKQSIYSQVRRALGTNTVDISYRYFWDDWGVNSHTVNLYYMWDMKNSKSLQPHVRWYHQSAADFYVPTFIENKALPQFATSDYRLGKFSAITVGLQYSFPITAVNTMRFTVEYYTQFGDSSPPGLVGTQLTNDNFPTLNSLLVRVGYNFGF